MFGVTTRSPQVGLHKCITAGCAMSYKPQGLACCHDDCTLTSWGREGACFLSHTHTSCSPAALLVHALQCADPAGCPFFEFLISTGEVELQLQGIDILQVAIIVALGEHMSLTLACSSRHSACMHMLMSHVKPSICCPSLCLSSSSGGSNLVFAISRITSVDLVCYSKVEMVAELC